MTLKLCTSARERHQRPRRADTFEGTKANVEIAYWQNNWLHLMNERCQAEAKKNRKKELSKKSRISSQSVRVTARSCGSFLGGGEGGGEETELNR